MTQCCSQLDYKHWRQSIANIYSQFLIPTPVRTVPPHRGSKEINPCSYFSPLLFHIHSIFCNLLQSREFVSCLHWYAHTQCVKGHLKCVWGFVIINGDYYWYRDHVDVHCFSFKIIKQNWFIMYSQCRCDVCLHINLRKIEQRLNIINQLILNVSDTLFSSDNVAVGFEVV